MICVHGEVWWNHGRHRDITPSLSDTIACPTHTRMICAAGRFFSHFGQKRSCWRRKRNFMDFLLNNSFWRHHLHLELEFAARPYPWIIRKKTMTSCVQTPQGNCTELFLQLRRLKIPFGCDVFMERVKQLYMDWHKPKALFFEFRKKRLSAVGAVVRDRKWFDRRRRHTISAQESMPLIPSILMRTKPIETYCGPIDFLSKLLFYKDLFGNNDESVMTTIEAPINHSSPHQFYRLRGHILESVTDSPRQAL